MLNTFRFFLPAMLFTLNAFAQDADSTPTGLKQIMKQAGVIFKSIESTINDPSKNLESGKAAGDLVELFELSQTKAPPNENVDLEGYRNLIQKCIDGSKALQQAFLNNDNMSATTIYSELKKLKTEGHDQYDP